jgi:hypothetical protein
MRRFIAASTEEAAELLSFGRNKPTIFYFSTVFTLLQPTCFPSLHQVAYN